MTIDQREFRNAVGCFATGVTVITTLDEAGARIGITANSFSSLSLDPPLVLFCVDAKINSFGAFESCDHFNVNVLAEGQMALSNNFARSSDDKWDGIEHGYGDNGSPRFENSIAVFECEKHSMYEGGDHMIIIGKVIKMTYEASDCRPLVYFKGSYANIS